MKALVVYDSVFGNTEQIARAMSEALATQAVRVGEASAQLADVDLLIVGSPTRGFRPTPAMTTWLKGLPEGALKGVKAAAFDTRIAPSDIKSPIFRWIVTRGGYADKGIAKLLAAKGATLAAAGEGFIVKASEGPLKDGELARAAEWASSLARG
jgi:flavodoxin